MKIPKDFLTRLREPLGWNDLRYAYESQLVDSDAVIEHGCRVLSETESEDDDILAIASAKPADELKPFLSRLAGPANRTSELKRKWGLILAAFIGESDIVDKLGAIEEVYSAFDYPEELAQFVRYMPMNGPDLGSREANENRMLESLKEFAEHIVERNKTG